MLVEFLRVIQTGLLMHNIQQVKLYHLTIDIIELKHYILPQQHLIQRIIRRYLHCQLLVEEMLILDNLGIKQKNLLCPTEQNLDHFKT